MGGGLSPQQKKSPLSSTLLNDENLNRHTPSSVISCRYLSADLSHIFPKSSDIFQVLVSLSSILNICPSQALSEVRMLYRFQRENQAKISF